VAGWVQALIESAAVVTAVGVLIASTVKAWRAMRRGWVQAVAHEVDGKVAAVREEIAQLRTDAERRFDDIDARIGEPNGRGNVVEMLEDILRRHEQTDETDELDAGGDYGRRSTDPDSGQS
jgi:hypothetical protein